MPQPDDAPAALYAAGERGDPIGLKGTPIGPIVAYPRDMRQKNHHSNVAEMLNAGSSASRISISTVLMGRFPSTFRSTDITRALKAVRAASYSSVRVLIDKTGRIEQDIRRRGRGSRSRAGGCHRRPSLPLDQCSGVVVASTSRVRRMDCTHRLKRPRNCAARSRPSRAMWQAVRSTTSSSATARSARAACSPMVISINSLPLKPERIFHVALSEAAFAILVLRISNRRLSLLRQHQSHHPAGSRKKYRTPNARRPRQTLPR